MDILTFNRVYLVPLLVGPTVRIRVQQYEDGDACFIAAPRIGEFDEPPAMNAIAALKGYLEAAGEEIRVAEREYRFLDDNGGRSRVVKVPDTVIVPDGAYRIKEILNIIRRAAISPETEQQAEV